MDLDINGGADMLMHLGNVTPTEFSPQPNQHSNGLFVTQLIGTGRQNISKIPEHELEIPLIIGFLVFQVVKIVSSCIDHLEPPLTLISDDVPPIQCLPTLPGNRIVNISHFLGQLLNDKHVPIYNCGFQDMDFIGEIHVKGCSQLSSQLLFKCRMCNLNSKYSLLPKDSELDKKLVNGVLTTGKAFIHLNIT